MSPRHKGRQAVYIGVAPDDWKPSSLWSVPPRLDNVVCFEKNLSMQAALGFARAHNKRQLQNSKPGRKWAIVSRHLKANRPGEHPVANTRRRTRKDFEVKVLSCAKRLFSEPAFENKTPADRELLLKLATLRVLERIPEGCLLDGLEAIRRHGAMLPDKPVAYLTTVIKDWFKKYNKRTLDELLVEVEVPAGLVKTKQEWKEAVSW